MHPFARMIAAAAALVCCTGLAAPERIDYVLTPVLRDGALQAVQIDLNFRADADGETLLRLPQSWGGEEELWRGIEELSVVSGAAMRDGDGPGQRVLTSRPGAPIHIRYRVIQDWPGAPRAELGNTYRPTIQPSYFHLIGDTALVTPDADLVTPVRVRVRHLPRGWIYASDLEHDGLTLAQVWSSVTVAGDFRLLRSDDGATRVAIRGQWSFNDAAFAEQIDHIVAVQREFWGDAPEPFLVTVLQLDGPQNRMSIGGTGLGDAFAFFATPNAQARPLTRTLAHEALHTWIPHRIGEAPDQNEAAQYWLSEGFTDFYTPRLLLRAGLWTPEDFAADLNEMLAAYAQSPVRSEPNARVVADFWNDQDVQKLPYQRGRLLAMVWDAQLRASGHDFDDVVLAMRERARSETEQKAVELFPAVAAEFGLDVHADLAHFIDAGAPILLPEDVFAPCGRIETRNVPIFHRGFDISATQANNNVISGVDPSLPAYAAGMRDGMILVRRDAGEIGNSELEIAYVVREGEVDRTIRYMPRGHRMLEQQRLLLANDLAGEALDQCIRVLGGA